MDAAVLINGRSEDRVDAADRGFQYGDGVFTTLPVLSGRPIFLSLHLARLERDCARLRIPFPGVSLLQAEVRQLCRMQGEGVLKIQITRGCGDRGYRPPAEPNPTRVIRLSAGIPTRPGLPGQGATIRFCQHRLGSNPALAGVKHLNRLEQVMARAEWESDAVHEGLMSDGAGALIEGTMSNLFAVIA
ncbi:MAG: aminodeoxychorismate lyase, partial [Gammaproteobacteria bacterium]|nr:aminodeoxychorismate lyase [Gammaproteobacteria bacterium]